MEIHPVLPAEKIGGDAFCAGAAEHSNAVAMPVPQTANILEFHMALSLLMGAKEKLLRNRSSWLPEWVRPRRGNDRRRIRRKTIPASADRRGARDASRARALSTYPGPR